MSFELQIVIKTTVVLLIGCLTAWILRRASAATRHALWVIALCNALLLPVVIRSLPPIAIPVLKESAPAAQMAQPISVIPPAPPSLATRVLLPGHEAESVAAASAPAPETIFTLQNIISAIWFTGVLLLMARLIRSTFIVRRLARSSAIVQAAEWNELRSQLQHELGIASTVQIRMAGELPPMTWGIVRHTILLPESANEWTEARRRVVLAHELAHAKRRDGMVQILVQIIHSFYWFSPMVWLAASRLRIERERACDDQVLNLGVKAEDYAQHLLDIARGSRRGPSFATVSMADPSQLETRLVSILDSRARRRRLSRRALIVLVIVIGVLTASVSALQVTAIAALALPSFEMPLAAPAWVGTLTTVLQQEPVAETASVAGTVRRAGTNEPLRRARVILNPTEEGILLTDTTDEAGRFTIQNVPPGRYQLMATRDGYVRTEFGQKTLNGSGTPVNLAGQQALQGIVLTLTPTGAISGRIRNRNGEPVANAAVQAQRMSYEAGRPVLQLLQTVRSNDIGEYRLYYLEPGQYIVSALPPTGIRVLAGEASRSANFQTGSVEILPGSQRSSGPSASAAFRSGIFTTVDGLNAMGFVSPANTGETYLPVFFPGVSNVSAAVPVVVKPGETFGAVDFSVSEVRAVRIRGQVTSSTGQPVRGVSMVLLSQGTSIPGLPIDYYGKISDTGAFEFTGIAPGSYELVASTGALGRGMRSIGDSSPGGAAILRGPARGGAPPNNTAARQVGRLPIQVGAGDIESVTLALDSGITTTGKISIEGLSAAESGALTSGLIIQLQPDPPDIFPENGPSQRVQTASNPASVATDGTFSLTSVFRGKYQIGILNGGKLPSAAYVKSAQWNEQDALSPRLVVDGVPRSPLEIVLATNPGSLDVRVADDRQNAATAVSVVVIPDASRRQRYDLYRTAITDDRGHALLAELPPGDYFVYASDALAKGNYWDAEFVRTFADIGKPLHVDANGKHTVELKWNPNR